MDGSCPNGCDVGFLVINVIKVQLNILQCKKNSRVIHELSKIVVLIPIIVSFFEGEHICTKKLVIKNTKQ